MAQNPIPGLVEARLKRWNAQHPQHQVDLKALAAVGGQEGYSGRIGDSGHAFGPWQLNDAGGVLTGKFPGWSPQQKQSWASSAPGIDYALAGIANVAGGLRGPQAVRSIVSRFERPRDIPGETARALASYGLGGAGAGPSVPVPAAAATASPGAVPNVAPPPLPNPGPGLLKTLSNAGGDYTNFYQQLGVAGQRQLAQAATAAPVAGQLGQNPAAMPARQAAGPHVSPIAPNYKYGRIDQGVDVSQDRPYVSPGSGIVTRIGQVAGGTNLGVYVKLDHPITVNGRTYPGIYVWHTSPLVKPGQRVKGGQPIMSAGSAEVGFATADGRPVAPLVGGLGAGTKPSSQGADMKAFADSLNRGGRRR